MFGAMKKRSKKVKSVFFVFPGEKKSLYFWNYKNKSYLCTRNHKPTWLSW